MSDYHEIYEEINNHKKERMPRQYKSPGYNVVQDYYNEYPERGINKFNPQAQEHIEEYYDYYTDSSPIYYKNQDKNKKRFYTPDRINNNNLYLNGQSNRNEYISDYENRSMNIYNLREDYSYPSKGRVNIRKKVYKGSFTPQPYYNDKEEEYIDNYQYHETTNIKDKDNSNKKYDSITHIIGYSNLIPLNRMKNLYGYDNNYRNYEENRGYNNYKNAQEPKIKKAIEKVQEIQRGKKEYDNFMNKLNSNFKNENDYYRKEKYRREISTNISNDDYRRRNENNYKIENIRKNYNRKQNNIKHKIPRSKYTYKNNISEDIDYYRNNDNYNREEDNIRSQEIYHKNNKEKVTKYNKVPYMNNYKKNFSSTNIKQSANSKLNRIYDYKYNNRSNRRNYNEDNRTKVNKTGVNLGERNRINNSYRTNNYNNKNKSSYLSNYNKREYNSNIDPNKLKSILKVEEKTASLNFQNPKKKVYTYGENFDAEKYKREYVNIENVDDGRIENHIETSLSKDGQYLISVTSATKVYDENRNENNNENEEDFDDGYERREEVEEEEEEENIEEIPEKNVEEIVSTVTTKRKNLGDNYKFYESKDLRKPNLTSFTSHNRRGERTIYGNEEYETKEIKRYRIGPDGKKEDIEYIQNEDEDDYEQQEYDNDHNYRGKEGQYYDGDYEEENNYEQEEVYYQ